MSTRLYTPDRLAGYDTRTLGTLFTMAHHDTQCVHSIYLAMDRAQTVATAWRSCSDIASELSTRHADGDIMAGAVLHDLRRAIATIPQ